MTSICIQLIQWPSIELLNNELILPVCILIVHDSILLLNENVSFSQHAGCDRYFFYYLCIKRRLQATKKRLNWSKNRKLSFASIILKHYIKQYNKKLSTSKEVEWRVHSKRWNRLVNSDDSLITMSVIFFYSTFTQSKCSNFSLSRNRFSSINR